MTLRPGSTIAADETVTTDTRPWVRSVLRQDGASLAGTLRGAALADFRLPVGQALLHYSGTELSGQSSSSVRWCDA